MNVHAHTHYEISAHEVLGALAGCCHIEAAEEREAFLRALLEEHAEAGDGWRKLIQWNSGVDESLIGYVSCGIRMTALPKSEQLQF